MDQNSELKELREEVFILQQQMKGIRQEMQSFCTPKNKFDKLNMKVKKLIYDLAIKN